MRGVVGSVTDADLADVPADGDESAGGADRDSAPDGTDPEPEVDVSSDDEPEPAVTFDPPADGPDLLGPQIVAAGDLLDLVFRPTDGEPFVVDRRGRVLRLTDDGGPRPGSRHHVGAHA